MNIIYEETEGYFQDRKDVESVADVIQNRVGLYLQEKRERMPVFRGKNLYVA